MDHIGKQSSHPKKSQRAASHWRLVSLLPHLPDPDSFESICTWGLKAHLSQASSSSQVDLVLVHLFRGESRGMSRNEEITIPLKGHLGIVGSPKLPSWSVYS